MAKFDFTKQGTPHHLKPQAYNPETGKFELYFDGTDELGDYNKKEIEAEIHWNSISIPSKQEHDRHTTGASREKMQSIRYDYMPSRIVNDAYARVAEFGARKYEPDNWMKGLPQSQIASSLQRHLWAYLDGEDNDKESGLCHLDHVLWNAVALVYNRYHDLEDDRFESRKVSK